MDLTYPDSAEEFRARIHTFIEANVPTGFAGLGSLTQDGRDVFMQQWRAVLADANLLAVSWPTEYGGAGLTPIEQVVIAENSPRQAYPAAPKTTSSASDCSVTPSRCGEPKSRSDTSCPASFPVKTCGAKDIRNPTRVRILPVFAPAPSSTETSG